MGPSFNLRMPKRIKPIWYMLTNWIFVHKISLALFMGTLLSLTFSLGSSELFVMMIESENIRVWLDVAAVFSLLFAVVIPSAAVIFAIFASFRLQIGQPAKVGPLFIILASYFSIILIFAGLYYSMSVITDLDDAAGKYHGYQGQHRRIGWEPDYQYQLIQDRNAFRDISTRFWSGPDWPYTEEGYRRRASPAPLDAVVSATERPFDRVVRFQPGSRVAFFDYLHISVVTITSLGWGDVAPRRWYAKLATDVEVLIGLVLFVVALGMLFGNWRSERNT
ncbi:MAG: ion channel [Dehalococcoidia bacterium]